MNNPFEMHQVLVTESDVLDLIVEYTMNHPDPVVGGMVSLDAGTAAAPSLTFAPADNYGMYSSGSESVDFATNGLTHLTVSDTVNVGGYAWTVPADLSAAASLNAVAYAPELTRFAIVGSEVAWSTNATAWNVGTNPDITNVWSALTYAPAQTRFVAVCPPGTSGSLAMYSDNGATWTLGSTPSDSDWAAVAWSPELSQYCAFSTGGPHSVMTSTTGASWTTRTAPANSYATGLWVAEQTRYVALPYDNGVDPYFPFGIASANGTSWTTFSNAGIGSTQRLAWSPELTLFASIPDSSAVIYTSPDCVAWTTHTSPVTFGWPHALCWASGMGEFMAVSNSGQYVYSHDGETWRGTLMAPAAVSAIGIAYSDELEKYVASAIANGGILVAQTGESHTSLLVSGDTVTVDAPVYPLVDAVYDLGSGTNRWGTVYAQTGTINTSDRNQKTQIAASDLGLDFVEALVPVSYKFADTAHQTYRRTHYGLIAQDVETALAERGIDPVNFGGLVKFKQGSEMGYGLRYDEFIAPLIRAVQELAERVRKLEELEQVEELEEVDEVVEEVAMDM